MRTDARRVTLVARSLSTPDRDWDDSSAAVTRTIFVDSFAVLKYAIRAGIVDMEIDIERVVVDRAASPATSSSSTRTTPRSSVPPAGAAIACSTRSPPRTCASTWKLTAWSPDAWPWSSA
jgi:hypothetical protein